MKSYKEGNEKAWFEWWRVWKDVGIKDKFKVISLYCMIPREDKSQIYVIMPIWNEGTLLPRSNIDTWITHLISFMIGSKSKVFHGVCFLGL